MEKDQSVDTKSKEFEALPDPIKNWLGSETATEVIIALNKRHKIWTYKLRVIPRLIAQLVSRMIEPEEFADKLKFYLPFVDIEGINDISFQIQKRILKPVAGTLKNPFDIDIDKINTKLRKPEIKEPEAKITEIKTPIQPEKEIIKETKPEMKAPGVPAAKVTEFKRPEVKPETGPDLTSIPKKDKSLEDDKARVTDPEKPFTLQEQQSPPQKKEIAKYNDNHPTT